MKFDRALSRAMSVFFRFVLSARLLILVISLNLAFSLGVFGTKHILSSFTRMEGCQAKSGSLFCPPDDLALERATNRAPGFWASNLLVPGLMTMYLLA